MPKIKPLAMILLLVAGCNSENDERLSRLTEQSLDAQAKQNEEIAKQSQSVADASHELVAADAKARQELVKAQEDLQQEFQTERQGLDRQHEDLEHERQEIAATRNRDPIVAGAILSIGALLACTLPIVLAIYLVRAMLRENPDEAVGELLVHELVADEPLLLPGRLTGLPAEPLPALTEEASADTGKLPW